VWWKGEGYTGFLWGNLRQGDHWGNPGVDGRIILVMDLREVRIACSNWICLAQDRDRCCARVIAVMTLRVP
jgi:hypothetical protein